MFFLANPPPTPRIIVGLGWHRRRETLYVYWGWRWLAKTLYNMPMTACYQYFEVDNQDAVFFVSCSLAVTMMVIDCRVRSYCAGWRTLTPHKGNDRVTQCEYGKAPTRQLHSNTHCCLWSGHTRKQSNSLAPSSISKKGGTRC